MKHANALAAKVAAHNRANAEANRLIPLYLAALAPFVGQTICKVDGSLRANVRAALQALHPPFVADGYATPAVYDSTGAGYSLSFTVKTCESYGDCGCVYAEVTIYVADLSSGVLAKLLDPQPWPTDYTAEKVHAARRAYDEAKRAASAAQSALYPFGEYDN